MDNLIVLESSNYLTALCTDIRNVNVTGPELKKRLIRLGELVGSEIASHEFVRAATVQTPMGQTFSGLAMDDKHVVIISTKDDFESFSNGISRHFRSKTTGFMDFAGERGRTTYNSQVRTIILPDLPKGKRVDAVIIAKSVLATGCTAVTLAKTALQKFMPNKLIITSCFYSEQAIEELFQELPNAKLYLVGSPDQLNENGMLIPGVGNIDERQNAA